MVTQYKREDVTEEQYKKIAGKLTGLPDHIIQTHPDLIKAFRARLSNALEGEYNNQNLDDILRNVITRLVSLYAELRTGFLQSYGKRIFCSKTSVADLRELFDNEIEGVIREMIAEKPTKRYPSDLFQKDHSGQYLHPSKEREEYRSVLNGINTRSDHLATQIKRDIVKEVDALVAEAIGKRK